MILTFVLAMEVAAAHCPPPIIEAASVREWSENIAVVSSSSSGLSGFGLVVAWRPGEAWVSVPAHVVFGKGYLPVDTAPVRTGLSVRLNGDLSDRPLCTTSSGRMNPLAPQGAADLTFVCVQWNDVTPVFNTHIVARQVEAGDRVQLAGPGPVGAIYGRVARTALPEDVLNEAGDIKADRLEGEEGMSGAPAVTAAGVIGQYLGRNAGGRVLATDTIRTKARNAELPWRLMEHEFYDCRRTKQVCVTAAGAVTPAAIVMDDDRIPASVTIPTGKCADVREGKYSLAVAADDVLCEPKLVSVVGMAGVAAPLTIKLSCTPRFGGRWRSTTGDELTCIDVDSGMAQCSGLTGLAWGFVEGRLSANGARVVFIGSAQRGDGRFPSVDGRFRWTPGTLSGEMTMNQTVKRIELQRVEE